MPRVLVLAALAALLTQGAFAADTLTGKIIAIDPAKSALKIGPTMVNWKSVKPDGFQVGDEVQITYTQDDVHDPYVLQSIKKK
ncbi:MAG: hypothetical protein EXQ88_02680 [Alphaproteobacteria bacterium]|nr:hypothetical protein [Alphaproteobacteria bacterium]